MIRLSALLKQCTVLTFISRVHPLSQQEAAELLLSQLSVLDLHQVRSHPERIVLEVSFAVLATTRMQTHNVKTLS